MKKIYNYFFYALFLSVFILIVFSSSTEKKYGFIFMSYLFVVFIITRFKKMKEIFLIMIILVVSLIFFLIMFLTKGGLWI